MDDDKIPSSKYLIYLENTLESSVVLRRISVSAFSILPGCLCHELAVHHSRNRATCGRITRLQSSHRGTFDAFIYFSGYFLPQETDILINTLQLITLRQPASGILIYTVMIHLSLPSAPFWRLSERFHWYPHLLKDLILVKFKNSAGLLL